MKNMYSISAEYYDEIYIANGKDYPFEVKLAGKYIEEYKQSKGTRLLDVGCGTGIHANLLSKYYQVEGLDIEKRMITVARRNFPHIRFHQGDMVNFKLNRKFDIIASFFSAIGHVKTKPRLQKTIKNLSQHLLPGGVLLIEPWFTPDQWYPGRVNTIFVDKPDVKIIRMSRSLQRGNISLIKCEYLIGTSKGIKRADEVLELGLFTKKEYLDAFRSAGLKVVFDSKGVDGRGIYIGMKT